MDDGGNVPEWESYEPGSYHRVDAGDSPAGAWLHHHFLTWCGYVAVPPGHPWHGLTHACIEDDPLDRLNRATHGGITHAATNPYLNEAAGFPVDASLWWFGFDCGHYRDLIPGIDSLLQAHLRGGKDETYRTLDYVTDRCKAMATVVTEAQAALTVP